MERARGLREKAARCLRLSRSIDAPTEVAWLHALAAEATLDADRIEAQEAAGKYSRLPIQQLEPRAVAGSGCRGLLGSKDLCQCGDVSSLREQEECQPASGELVASIDELRALKEELSVLKGELEETVERERNTADDLQNAISSSPVSTLFLDKEMNIRFFAPAANELFPIISSDIGRPLSYAGLLAFGGNLLCDARTVLQTIESIDRQIGSSNGSYYIRRVQPYRTLSGNVEGVVATFANVTESHLTETKTKLANQQADHVSAARSRFVAAVDHSFRQPLQILTLVHGLLAEHVETEKAKRLVARLDETLGAMSGMLTALRYENQMEAGTLSVEMTDFPIAELMERLRDEFRDHARAKGLTLSVVASSLVVNSDPRLLEQIIRSLLSIALKYTRFGKILLGCRRRGGTVSIEVWNTGLDIPHKEYLTILEDSVRSDNMSAVRSPSVGLLIVHRLSTLLGHRVGVNSRSGLRSVFSVEVNRTVIVSKPASPGAGHRANHHQDGDDNHRGSILLVEDDPILRELLEVFLTNRGYNVATASDGVRAGELAAEGKLRPDLILADHTLPNDLSGRTLAIQLRELLNRAVPAIIFAGNISRGISGEGELQDYVQLEKPVKLQELIQFVQRLLPRPKVGNHAYDANLMERSKGPRRPLVFVVEGDDNVRGAIRILLENESFLVEDYTSAEAFLANPRPRREACLVVGAYLSGMNGRTLLKKLTDAGKHIPAIMITGDGDVPMAVEAMKAGASDVIERPINGSDLIARVSQALGEPRGSAKLSSRREDSASHIAGLTPRQRQVMTMVLAGYPSKNIAADLGISQRTVEKHRAAIMTKTGTKSLATLTRLALAATIDDVG